MNNNETIKNLLQNKKNLGIALSWFFGVMFSFFGFIGIVTLDFIPGIIMALMGAVLLPPASKFLEEKYKIKLTTLQKTIFLVAGFFIFGIVSEPSKTEQKKPVEVTKQEQIVAEQVTKEEVTNKSDPVVQAEITEQKKLYSVVKVVDGDTLAVNIDGKEEVLRLIGINTPETVDPRKPVECFGAEASAKAKEILSGKNISLEVDSTQGERDKYSRLLRYVYLEDGTNFNKLMIEQGYAYEYTYNTPYKYQTDFKASQQNAKDKKNGLWADDTCGGNLTKQTASPSGAIQTQAEPTVQTKTTTSQPTQSSSFSGSCGSKKTCGQMANCQEAYFYLNNCGVGSLDRDKDGVPCETICN